MEPITSASTGGGLPANHAAATEPWTTSPRSPTPLPSTSKAMNRWPLPSASTSRNAPLGRPATRRVAHTLPITVAVSISAPCPQFSN